MNSEEKKHNPYPHGLYFRNVQDRVRDGNELNKSRLT